MTSRSVREVDGRKLDPFPADVLPNVELGPVRQWEGPQVLARTHAALVELPQFGALSFRIPLPEGIAEGEDAFLRPGLVLVASGATEGGVEPVGVDGVEQRRCLQAVARRRRPRIGHPALIDGVLDPGDEEPGPLGLDLRVSVGEHLGEIVSRVHVEDGEGDPPRLERLGGEMQQDRRILPPAEEEHGAL